MKILSPLLVMAATALVLAAVAATAPSLIFWFVAGFNAAPHGSWEVSSLWWTSLIPASAVLLTGLWLRRQDRTPIPWHFLATAAIWSGCVGAIGLIAAFKIHLPSPTLEASSQQLVEELRQQGLTVNVFDLRKRVMGWAYALSLIVVFWITGL